MPRQISVFDQNLLNFMRKNKESFQTAPEWAYSFPNVQPARIYTALNRLEKQQLVKSHKVGPNRYWAAVVATKATN